MDGRSLVDAATFDGLKELLGEAFSQLIETYLTDSQVRIDKLKQSVPAGDFETTTHEAHGLKGSSRNIGIVPLGDVCESLEQESRAEKPDNLEQYLATIEQQFAALTEYLKTEL